MGKYDDIIDLEHPTSSKHPRMSLYDRAAQFSPFAALTGHDAAIKETARLTEDKIELDEDARIRLDEKLQMIRKCKHVNPQVSVTYFVSDEQKSGGKYVTVHGNINYIDSYRHRMVMGDGTIILLEDIVEIDGSLFEI